MDPALYIPTTLIGCAATLLGVAAVVDVKVRRIPNKLNVVLAVLGILYVLQGWTFGLSFTTAILWPLAASLALFAGGLLLFALRLMGGGDVKMMAAFGLFAGPQFALPFILLTTLLGGVLALITLITARLMPRWATPSANSGEITAKHTVTVPYGVAIAGAGLWTCLRLLSQTIA